MGTASVRCAHGGAVRQAAGGQGETLNDLDGRAVRFWRALRDRPDELARAVALTPYSRREWEACRADVDVEDDDVEASRRFLVWVGQSFSREGTGWSPPSIRVGRRGRWQPGCWQNLPEKLAAAASGLSGVALEHGDAIDLIARYDEPGTVIYCDPPYAGPCRLAPGKGYEHDRAEELWPRLIEAFSEVRHAGVILSGYPNAYVSELGGWDDVVELAHRRSVAAGSGSTLASAPERVWLNPNIVGGAGRLFEPGRAVGGWA